MSVNDKKNAETNGVSSDVEEIFEDNDKDEETEYNVEAIRDKRINKETGCIEYLIKWEGYSEDDNTWEPRDHLECPELLAKFEEETVNKRRSRLSARRGRPKKDRNANSSIHQRAGDALIEQNGFHSSRETTPLISDDEMGSIDVKLTPSTSKRAQEKKISREKTIEDKQEEDSVPKTGFNRGLELDTILGAVTDDNDDLWFMLKWKSETEEVEMVPVQELEEKATKELCVWYRQRLRHFVKTSGDVPSDY